MFYIRRVKVNIIYIKFSTYNLKVFKSNDKTTHFLSELNWQHLKYNFNYNCKTKVMNFAVKLRKHFQQYGHN